VGSAALHDDSRSGGDSWARLGGSVFAPRVHEEGSVVGSAQGQRPPASDPEVVGSFVCFADTPALNRLRKEQDQPLPATDSLTFPVTNGHTNNTHL
jgi:hypothetical protein